MEPNTARLTEHRISRPCNMNHMTLEDGERRLQSTLKDVDFIDV